MKKWQLIVDWLPRNINCSCLVTFTYLQLGTKDWLQIKVISKFKLDTMEIAATVANSRGGINSRIFCVDIKTGLKPNGRPYLLILVPHTWSTKKIGLAQMFNFPEHSSVRILAVCKNGLEWFKKTNIRLSKQIWYSVWTNSTYTYRRQCDRGCLLTLANR